MLHKYQTDSQTNDSLLRILMLCIYMWHSTITVAVISFMYTVFYAGCSANSFVNLVKKPVS